MEKQEIYHLSYSQYNNTMKKILFLFAAFVLLIPKMELSAQVLDGVYVKEHVPVRNPIPYTSLREADVMWSKKVVRQLDLKEKLNHSLYYPTKAFSDRKSLMQLILWGFSEASKTAYDFNMSMTYEIVNPITIQQALTNLGGGTDTITIKDINGNPLRDTVVTRNPQETTNEIQFLLMKEEWFFDKQRSVMDVRIIGIAPMRRYEDISAPGVFKTSIPFWIYFPEFRDLFSKTDVFNTGNDAERRTFDDIFWKRKFSSYIIKESNVYNDRVVANYALGLEAMLEGEKIKDAIFKIEHDLWEY